MDLNFTPVNSSFTFANEHVLLLNYNLLYYICVTHQCYGVTEDLFHYMYTIVTRNDL